MRWTSTIVGVVVVLAVASAGLRAQDPPAKNGQLAKPLKIVQLQGGFAGFTGMQYTIAPDGAWKSASVFNQKLTPKGAGKLTSKEQAKLSAILEKYELAKLPEKAGKQPGANPHTITFEYGKKKASLVGQTPPKIDVNNPTGSVESRFAGILEGVVGLLTPPGGKNR